MLQLCTSFMVHISTIPANLINNSYNASLYSSFSLKRRLVKLKQPSYSRSIRLRSARVFPKDRRNTLARTTKPEALVLIRCATTYLCLSTTCRSDLKARPEGSNRPFLPLKFTRGKLSRYTCPQVYPYKISIVSKAHHD